jgi:signal peptidase I
MTTEKNEPPRARRGPSPLRRAFYIAFLVFALVFLYLLWYRGLTFFRVPSESMVPTLAPGDYIYTLPEKVYRRGDIVVLRDPLMKDGYLVKRIVAVPGDTVEINLGYLSINGKYASEPYIREPMNYALEKLTVPEGEILVLGDNRNESDDASRWLIDPDTGKAIDAPNAQTDVVDGKRWKRTVPLSTVVGRVRYRYLPFDRMGPIASFPLTNSAGQ